MTLTEEAGSVHRLTFPIWLRAMYTRQKLQKLLLENMCNRKIGYCVEQYWCWKEETKQGYSWIKEDEGLR